jgi:hypothetical protein
MAPAFGGPQQIPTSGQPSTLGSLEDRNPERSRCHMSTFDPPHSARHLYVPLQNPRRSGVLIRFRPVKPGLPKSGPPGFRDALSTYEPGNRRCDGILSGNYLETLLADVKAAFVFPGLAWESCRSGNHTVLGNGEFQCDRWPRNIFSFSRYICTSYYLCESQKGCNNHSVQTKWPKNRSSLRDANRTTCHEEVGDWVSG